MCTVCGCSEGEVTIEGGNSHDHNHQHGHDHHYGKGPAHAHAPGLSQSRMVQIETDILAKNNEYASANRAEFTKRGVLALNLVSSPGSGKTTLLTRSIEDMKAKTNIAVTKGDQQTANDAERIRETGVPAIQVNTGKGCHLDGHMVGHALEHLEINNGVLFIENVGNLDFDVEKCMEYARRVNPRIKILQISAKSGDGLQDWYSWIKASQMMNNIGSQ